MVDIIIYTTKEKLLHKQDKLEGDIDKGDYGIYYWEFSRFPKSITKEDKIYFAIEGFIVGYFEILDMNTGEICGSQDPLGIPDNSISWFANSWKEIKPIPTKSFQGFKYANKVSELKKEVRNSSQIFYEAMKKDVINLYNVGYLGNEEVEYYKDVHLTILKKEYGKMEFDFKNLNKERNNFLRYIRDLVNLSKIKDSMDM